jgi:Domain of unknown function (DUF4123)
VFNHRLLTTAAFGIADASMVERLPETLTQQRLCPKALQGSAHLMPVMVNLRAMRLEDSAALLAGIDLAHERQEPPPVAVFVTSDQSVERFAAHWNALQMLRGEAGNAWLRLHDPRVLHQLLRILHPPQVARLFAGTTSIDYCLHGQWLRVDKPATTRPDAEATRVSTTTEWDWLRIARIGLINRALQQAGRLAAEEQRDGGRLVEDLFRRASERHGLVEQDDLVEFAYRGLRFGPGFDEHPQIRSNLRAEPGDSESRLADRLALISEPIWAALAASHAPVAKGVPS